MTIKYASGDKIESDRIVFEFGLVIQGNRKKNRYVGKFENRGWAQAVVQMKVNVDGSPAAPPDRIDCVTAKYECNDNPRIIRKGTLRNHTGYKGRIKGKAEATIVRPHDNHPDPKPAADTPDPPVRRPRKGRKRR